MSNNSMDLQKKMSQFQVFPYQKILEIFSIALSEESILVAPFKAEPASDKSQAGADS